MKIRINDKEFSKTELLQLINNNKIQAIIHVRTIVSLGLKEAKEIVDNLEENPDFYDRINIRKENNSFKEIESIVVDLKKVGKEDVLKIGSEVFPKKKLLRLINQSKLKAVKFLKETLKLNLSKCKEIVDNLAVNPNYYKNDIVVLTDLDKEIEKPNINGNSKKKGSHFIQENSQSKKKILIIGLVFIILILLYLLYK